MKYFLTGIVLFAYHYAIWGQDVLFPTNEDRSHVSGGNSTQITERLPVFIPNECPKNMLLYPGDGTKITWVCDCIPRFLYFPLNDSCHEAYMQGPCPLNHYVVLPRNESVPQCAENPCMEDGVVPFNNTCYELRASGGPCAPDGIIGVNETTFELECMPTEVATFNIIDPPKRTCPTGSRRNALGICKKVL